MAALRRDAGRTLRSVHPPTLEPQGYGCELVDLTVVAPVCGGSRDIDDSGMTAVQAGRTTATSFIFNCS